MTTRNEARIDILTDGGPKAERQLDRVASKTRGVGSAARGLGLPFLTGGLLAGGLAAGLLGVATGSGAASNGLIRIQGALDNLIGGLIRPLEGGLDNFTEFFEKLPGLAQVGLVGLGVILGALLIAGFKAGIAALSGYLATAFAGLGAPILSAITGIFSGIGVAVGAAIAVIAVGIASLAFIAWDLIFNDGEYLARFERWLSGFSWIQTVSRWDYELTEWFKGPFAQLFAGTIPELLDTVWGFLGDQFNSVFVNTFAAAWAGAVDIAVNAVNGIIRAINTMIRAVASIPIPTVSIGYRSVGALGASIAIPYPIVSTRPLGSFTGTFQLPTIPTRQERNAGGVTGDYGAASGRPGGVTIINNGNIDVENFEDRVRRILGSPGARAAANGEPY